METAEMTVIATVMVMSEVVVTAEVTVMVKVSVTAEVAMMAEVMVMAEMTFMFVSRVGFLTGSFCTKQITLSKKHLKKPVPIILIIRALLFSSTSTMMEIRI